MTRTCGLTPCLLYYGHTFGVIASFFFTQRVALLYACYTTATRWVNKKNCYDTERVALLYARYTTATRWVKKKLC